MSEGVSEAFYLAVDAIAAANGTPLPSGLSSTMVAGWDLTVNNSKETIGDIPPFNVKAAHDTYFAFGLFGPQGGLIGGVTEAAFIEALKNAKEAK